MIKGRIVAKGVWNSMRHDARVARSSGTLSEAGAHVTVVAASWNADEWGRTRHDLGFDVVTVKRARPWILNVGERGLSPLGLLLRILRTFPSQVKFMTALWRARADVYHAHDLQALPWVWLVAKLRRRPIIFDAHEISTDRTSLKRLAKVIAIVEGFLARRCDAMITTTDMRADYFVQQYGVRRPVVLQNRPYFRKVERSNRLRDVLDIRDEQILVLYQGGLQPGRGLEKLIDVIPDVPDAHFVFLGDGNLRDLLGRKVEALDETRRVHFLNAVPWEELPEWTASADIGVQVLENTCLNHYTTDSNKIFEYAMAGLPVVASDFPEIRKIVAGCGFGLLVDPANEKEIAQQLRRLVKDHDLRRTLADAAKVSRRNLSWETQVPALINIYKKLAPGA